MSTNDIAKIYFDIMDHDSVEDLFTPSTGYVPSSFYAAKAIALDKNGRKVAYGIEDTNNNPHNLADCQYLNAVPHLRNNQIPIKSDYARYTLLCKENNKLNGEDCVGHVRIDLYDTVKFYETNNAYINISFKLDFLNNNYSFNNHEYLKIFSLGTTTLIHIPNGIKLTRTTSSISNPVSTTYYFALCYCNGEPDANLDNVIRSGITLDYTYKQTLTGNMEEYELSNGNKFEYTAGIIALLDLNLSSNYTMDQDPTKIGFVNLGISIYDISRPTTNPYCLGLLLWYLDKDGRSMNCMVAPEWINHQTVIKYNILGNDILRPQNPIFLTNDYERDANILISPRDAFAHADIHLYNGEFGPMFISNYNNIDMDCGDTIHSKPGYQIANVDMTTYHNIPPILDDQGNVINPVIPGVIPPFPALGANIV